MKTQNIKENYIWQNLDCPSTQSAIKELTKGLSGVYMFHCKTAGAYVGSAISKSSSGNRLYLRFRNHLKHKKLSNSLLQKAIQKYGIDNFEFQILEICDPTVVRERETFYIQKINPRYNILKIAGSSQGYQHTVETRKKLKAA